MASKELDQIVCALGRQVQSHIDAPNTLSEFRDLVLSPALRTLLTDVLEAPAGKATLANSSQIHPNSFVKIPLVAAPNGAKLVIHRWLDLPVANPDFHNHRWNFVSTVLSGSLASVDYRSMTDPNGPFVQSAYESATDRDEYPLVPVGRSQLTPVRHHSVSAGDWYAQDHRIIHGAGSAKPGTISLILQGEVSVETCQVFRPLGADPSSTPVVAATELEVTSSIRLVLNFLEH